MQSTVEKRFQLECVEVPEIQDLKVFKPKVFPDDRGFFSETYNYSEWSEKCGFNEKFLQDNHSFSKYGVLRGLHSQPHMGKLVSVVTGEIFDVAVDIRKGSPTYGKWHGVVLNGTNKNAFWIPAGFLHGFQVLSKEGAHVTYKCSAVYDPKTEFGVDPFDKDINVDWPLKDPKDLIIMTLAARRDELTRRDAFWRDDDWLEDWRDWPVDWPRPRDLFHRFRGNSDSLWKDWPSDWPRMDAIMPRFSTNLDRLDRNWRNDPFWMDIYPRWAEPIFKDGIDVNSHVVNDERRFAVDVDCYQFKPEEIQVKTLDDTLLIEGRHEDIRDRDNFTKMYFVRKYQLPRDVDPASIQSSIDSKGRLAVEAAKLNNALSGRERMIPIEGAGRNSPRFNDNGTYQRNTSSPIHVHTGQDRSASSRSGRDSRAESLRDSPQSRDVYSSHSYSYHRSDSRSRNSPHDVTMRNEQRSFSPSARRIETSHTNGTNGFNQRNGNANFEQEDRASSRAHTQRSESRNGYRVDSPASTTTGILRNQPQHSPTSSSEYRSIKILRKTY
ncbi:unnamed protein product [Caenorhabditis auriculariae]|uniref:SHSP domain-containing protein n=1 Tax=Caenorhabditis auriculariae TaxID=2777116 RepID=A0A8S1H7U3_9PELO|nr:unnamed protein product [Caenorhabditis auriculariae]